MWNVRPSIPACRPEIKLKISAVVNCLPLLRKLIRECHPFQINNTCSWTILILFYAAVLRRKV